MAFEHFIELVIAKVQFAVFDGSHWVLQILKNFLEVVLQAHTDLNGVRKFLLHARLGELENRHYNNEEQTKVVVLEHTHYGVDHMEVFHPV